MRRLFGALAAFTGWLCVPLAGALGFATGGFARPDAFGVMPPDSVYGLPAILVFWVFLFAAIVAAMVFGYAFLSPDPSRPLLGGAAVLACVGVVLLPDPLGRVFGVLLFPGAALLAAAGQLVRPAVESPTLSRDATGSRGILVAVYSAPGPGDEVSGGAVLAPTSPAAEEAEPPGAEEAEPPAASAPEPDETAPVPDDTAPPAEDTPLVSEDTARGAVPSPIADAEPPAALAGTGADESGREAPLPAVAPKTACEWCSAPLPGGAERCPSCGASVIEPGSEREVAIAGLTAVQPELRSYAERVAAARRSEPAARRSRGLLGWLNSLEEPYGVLERDAAVDGANPVARVLLPPDADALKPPSAEVRAEMARIEREARRLREQAEAAGAGGQTPAAEETAGQGAEPPLVAAAPEDDPTPASAVDLAARPRRRRRGA